MLKPFLKPKVRFIDVAVKFPSCRIKTSKQPDFSNAADREGKFAANTAATYAL